MYNVYGFRFHFHFYLIDVPTVDVSSDRDDNFNDALFDRSDVPIKVHILCRL